MAKKTTLSKKLNKGFSALIGKKGGSAWKHDYKRGKK